MVDILDNDAKGNTGVWRLAVIELKSDISSEAFVAIAEILSYVYKAHGTYQSIKETKPDAGGADDE